LGQDALASGLQYGDATNAEHGEHVICTRLGLDRWLERASSVTSVNERFA
jgi:hypothetical protein